MRLAIAVMVAGTMVLVSCGDESVLDQPSSTQASTSTSAGTDSDDQAFPDIVEVIVTPQGDTFRFDVTVSSPYDTPARYADAWRIVAPDGSELGVRELTHDHATEQPFTRSLTGVEIPADVTEVTVGGRDLVNGWGGGTKTVTIDR